MSDQNPSFLLFGGFELVDVLLEGVPQVVDLEAGGETAGEVGLDGEGADVHQSRLLGHWEFNCVDCDAEV